MPQAQYIDSLASKFITDFVFTCQNPSDLPGFKTEITVPPCVDELTKWPEPVSGVNATMFDRYRLISLALTQELHRSGGGR